VTWDASFFLDKMLNKVDINNVRFAVRGLKNGMRAVLATKCGKPGEHLTSHIYKVSFNPSGLRRRGKLMGLKLLTPLAFAGGVN
jgi:hypothetical protein